MCQERPERRCLDQGLNCCIQDGCCFDDPSPPRMHSHLQPFDCYILGCKNGAQQYRNYGFISSSMVFVTLIQAYYILEGQYNKTVFLTMRDITRAVQARSVLQLPCP
ncbi:hypothetical protein BJX63DRAFT_387462 [Aspergillus granulosus]|uniref:Uncharacterized protein n=1 Tax=Aspergillus granulosus TaxID=176169 RepID=A0ABR4HLX2_9EURO